MLKEMFGLSALRRILSLIPLPNLILKFVTGCINFLYFKQSSPSHIFIVNCVEEKDDILVFS